MASLTGCSPPAGKRDDPFSSRLNIRLLPCISPICPTDRRKIFRFAVYLRQDSPGFFRQKQIPVQAEKILPLFAEFSQVLGPRLGFFFRDAVSARNERSNEVNHSVAVGVFVVLGIKHGNDLVPLNGESRIFQFWRKRSGKVGIGQMFIPGLENFIHAVLVGGVPDKRIHIRVNDGHAPTGAENTAHFGQVMSPPWWGLLR